jgi:DNA-directed RNA polymerase subunit M/transcription elongation factor TFIIS
MKIEQRRVVVRHRKKCGVTMNCKRCGHEMYQAFTEEYVCRECGNKYDKKGRFVSRDVIRRM